MATREPTPLPISDRRVRIAVVGLGTISELALPPYAERDDVEIVGLCDRDAARVARWGEVWPDALRTTDLDELLSVDADVVDVLVPTPAHADVVCAVLAAGFHVQVQKPIARNLEDADRMLAAAARTGAMLRVMEDYVFYPPIVTLRDVLASGEIGEPAGIHMKIVATGRGGWDVPMSSYQWQFEQAKDGRGMLVFDHGWHQLAVAIWLLGPVTRIFAWLGGTEIVPGIEMDAPATLVWEHANGVRGVLDITFAPDTLFRSDYYTGDERIEVTGTKGFVRCNRISAYGMQEPSVVVYRDGETRGFHAVDDRPPDAFRASTDHAIAYLRTVDGPLVMDGATARTVLATLLAALDAATPGTIVEVVTGS
jgi:predicted dehydrogenase